jgi:hypothetical protein
MTSKWKIMTGVLALSLIATNAYAAQGGNGHSNNGSGEGKEGTTIKVEQGHQKGVTDSVYGDRSVTGSVYGQGSVTGDVYGHKGSGGLENAYEHAKNTPAGERIAELLKTKYNIDVQADADLSKLLADLEKKGNLKAAADVQAELIFNNINDIESYKMLGELMIKLGDKSVKLYVNGESLKLDVSALVEGGRTLVPFRAIAESLGADVKYDAASKTVTITRGNTTVSFVLGSSTAYVNGKAVALDVPGKVKKNRVLVPLRFLSEAFNANVNWENVTSSAIIVDKKNS